MRELPGVAVAACMAPSPSCRVGERRDAFARTSGRRPAHGPTRTLRGARDTGGRVGQPTKRLLKKRAPPPCRRRSRLRHDGVTDGVPVLVLRRHERTVMGVKNARMAGRYPVQVEHERGRRHGGMVGCHDEGVHRARWPGRHDVGLAGAQPMFHDVPSGSTFGWTGPGGFAPLIGLRRRSTPSPRGSACRALRLHRLDDDPATPASDQISTPLDHDWIRWHNL